MRGKGDEEGVRSGYFGNEGQPRHTLDIKLVMETCKHCNSNLYTHCSLNTHHMTYGSCVYTLYLTSLHTNLLLDVPLCSLRSLGQGLPHRLPHQVVEGLLSVTESQSVLASCTLERREAIQEGESKGTQNKCHLPNSGRKNRKGRG